MMMSIYLATPPKQFAEELGTVYGNSSIPLTVMHNFLE